MRSDDDLIDLLKSYITMLEDYREALSGSLSAASEYELLSSVIHDLNHLLEGNKT